MCHFTLETYDSCIAPEGHFKRGWTVKKCNLAYLNSIQCPNNQYRSSTDPVPCPLCQAEATSPGQPFDPTPSPGPEFQGEFSMGAQIAHMKAVFDRRRAEELARLGDEQVVEVEVVGDKDFMNLV